MATRLKAQQALNPLPFCSCLPPRDSSAAHLSLSALPISRPQDPNIYINVGCLYGVPYYTPALRVINQAATTINSYSIQAFKIQWLSLVTYQQTSPLWCCHQPLSLITYPTHPHKTSITSHNNACLQQRQSWPQAVNTCQCSMPEVPEKRPLLVRMQGRPPGETLQGTALSDSADAQPKARPQADQPCP